ncbi:CDK inhibitor PHO81 [Pseudohyphozyma bogoriensis]|nr:CDK inhibitor PHO81 [Pseudohyphozyma bogoriensis]
MLLIINSLAKGRPADAALLAAGVRPPRPGPEEPLHPDAAPFIANTASIGGRDGEGTLLQAHKAAFFFKLERELEKINNFYYHRESTLKVRLRTLIDKRKLLQASLSDSQGKVKALTRESSSFGALYEGFRNFERDLGRLQAFVELNATGFRKILKKWDKACRRQADGFGSELGPNPNVGERDGQLYLARQVDVQPVFNREFIAELSDVATANLLSLENLVVGEGKRRQAESLADGTGIERGTWAMTIDQADSAEALEDLELALVSAVKAGDKPGVQEILNLLVGTPPRPNPGAPVSRILWRAVLEIGPDQSTTEVLANGHPVVQEEEGLIPTSLLDFKYVDDINGRTCLHEAASAGRDSLVTICLEKGVEIAQADVYGRQALHYAAMNGHSEVCRVLLSAGADPTIADLDGYNASIYSVMNGRGAVVQTFIDQGVSFETPTSTAEDLNALSLACQFGHEDIARLLLQRGAKILPNPAGYYPQHLAAREGHAGVLRLLVEATRGFSGIDVPDKYSQATPLHHAASEGHTESVNVLLKAGSNVHAKDEFRKTPIHYAAWQGHIDVIVLLLAAGATSEATMSPEVLAVPGSVGVAATGSMSSVEMDPMDLEAELIPSLFLPPPIIPFRIYGHNFLDKKALVQITLGHPNTSRPPHLPPVHLNEQTGRGQHPSLKLVMTPKPDAGAIPHSVILPLADEGEVFPFQVDSFDSFSIEFDLFPTFGSKFIGKAVAHPSTFADFKSQGSYVVPLFDPHLKVIGEIPFEVNVVKPFPRAQLQLGGHLETYWKSTTTVTAGPSGEPAPNAAGGPSVVTASSLSGEHVRVVVQVTSDGVPVVYPQWRLPVEGFDVHVGEVSYAQFLALAQKTGRGLNPDTVVNKSEAAAWYQAIFGALASLDEVLKVLPTSIGVDLEVRYPTRSDVRRLKLHNILEVNQFVDCVLSTVYETVQTGDENNRRRIVLSSFNPIVCTALNWKQPNFSVFFASYCGLSRSSPEGRMVPANRVEDDRRCTSIREAVKFAKANNLLGIMLDATILVQVPSVIQTAKEHGLLITTFGTTSRVPLADAHMSSGVAAGMGKAKRRRTKRGEEVDRNVMTALKSQYAAIEARLNLAASTPTARLACEQLSGALTYHLLSCAKGILSVPDCPPLLDLTEIQQRVQQTAFSYIDTRHEVVVACLVALGSRRSSHSAIVNNPNSIKSRHTLREVSNLDWGSYRETACQKLVQRAVDLATESELLEDLSPESLEAVSMLRTTLFEERMHWAGKVVSISMLRGVNHIQRMDITSAAEDPLKLRNVFANLREFLSGCETYMLRLVALEAETQQHRGNVPPSKVFNHSATDTPAVSPHIGAIAVLCEASLLAEAERLCEVVSDAVLTALVETQRVRFVSWLATYVTILRDRQFAGTGTEANHSRALLLTALDLAPSWVDLAVEAARQDSVGEGPFSKLGLSWSLLNE